MSDFRIFIKLNENEKQKQKIMHQIFFQRITKKKNKILFLNLSFCLSMSVCVSVCAHPCVPGLLYRIQIEIFFFLEFWIRSVLCEKIRIFLKFFLWLLLFAPPKKNHKGLTNCLDQFSLSVIETETPI